MSVTSTSRPARLAASHLRTVERPADDIDRTTSVLVDRACAGDSAAWSSLYQRCYPAILRQLRYFTGDIAVAEELAQESFAQAMASCERFNRARSFEAWLRGIAHNVVRMYWRRRRNTAHAHARLEVISEARAPAGDDPDDVHLQRERSRVLYAVLAELPERLREAFVVRELQGLAMRDAAELLGITENNLAVRVHRARARILEELRRLGWLPTQEGAP